LRLFARGVAFSVVLGIGLARYEVRNDRLIEFWGESPEGVPYHGYFWSPCGGRLFTIHNLSSKGVIC
jgi:hypothetical protein